MSVLGHEQRFPPLLAERPLPVSETVRRCQ